MGAVVGGYFGVTQANINDVPWYQGMLKGALAGGVSGLGGGAIGTAVGGGFLGGFIGGGSGGAISGFSTALLYGETGREVLSATWKGGLPGAVGGGVGAYITGPTGAFVGGFTSGALGTALNGGDASDMILNGMVSGALSVASYKFQADRIHGRKSGDPVFDDPDNRFEMSQDAQKSFVTNKEEGGWLRHGNNPQRWPSGGKDYIFVGSRPSDARGAFHTHPNDGPTWIQQHSDVDISLTNNFMRVNHFVIARQNIYVQTPTQTPVLFAPTAQYLLINPYYLWYFGAQSARN